MCLHPCRKFVEEVVENVKNTNCEKNEDCMLVNTDYNWRCCYEGYCESPNYVSDKWISVNKVWFEQQQKKFCDFYKATSSNCTKELISKGKKCYENYKADGRFYGHCKKTETGGECIKMRVNHISSLEIALVVIFAFGTITVLAGFLAYFGCSTAISRLFKQYKFVTATEQERTGLVDNEDPADSDTEEDLMGTEGKSEEKKIEEVKVEEIKVDDKPAEETKSKEEKKTDEAKEPENKEAKTEEKSTAEEKTVEQEKSSDQNEKTTSDEQKV